MSTANKNQNSNSASLFMCSKCKTLYTKRLLGRMDLVKGHTNCCADTMPQLCHLRALRTKIKFANLGEVRFCRPCFLGCYGAYAEKEKLENESDSDGMEFYGNSKFSKNLKEEREDPDYYELNIKCYSCDRRMLRTLACTYVPRLEEYLCCVCTNQWLEKLENNCPLIPHRKPAKIEQKPRKSKRIHHARRKAKN